MAADIKLVAFVVIDDVDLLCERVILAIHLVIQLYPVLGDMKLGQTFFTAGHLFLLLSYARPFLRLLDTLGTLRIKYYPAEGVNKMAVYIPHDVM